MIVNFDGIKFPQSLIVRSVKIRFLKLCSIDKNHAVFDFDRFARQTDYSFDVAFIGFSRIPENHDVAACQMSPTDALKFVINQFIDQKAFTVVKLWQHRSSFDNDGLSDKNSQKNKNRNN